MGGKVELPTRMVKSLITVQIPQHIFGKRITIQAHDMTDVKVGKNPNDGHHCKQVDAKGDIQFFSRSVDITNYDK